MDQTVIQVLLVAAGVYFVMGVILVVNAEQIYGWARGSNMPVFTKGLFARAIVSYYNVKTRGLDAGWPHWGYCLAFNAGVSLTVSLIVAFGLALIALAIAIIIGIFVLMIIGAVLSGK